MSTSSPTRSQPTRFLTPEVRNPAPADQAHVNAVWARTPRSHAVRETALVAIRNGQPGAFAQRFGQLEDWKLVQMGEQSNAGVSILFAPGDITVARVSPTVAAGWEVYSFRYGLVVTLRLDTGFAGAKLL